jgi:hypothetical protein
MNNDLATRIQEQFPETVKRACRYGIDENETLRSGNLNQAEVRMKTVLSHEFGVESETRTGGQIITAPSQITRIGDDLFRQRADREGHERQTPWS